MTSTPPPVPPAHPARTLEDLHRDLEFANQYRLEFVKHTMTLAAGVFVFTLTFKEQMIGSGAVRGGAWAFGSWMAMILSLVGGLGQFVGWDRYYMTWRNYEWRNLDGKPARKVITRWRRFALVVQIASFVAGLALMAIFCALNM